MAGRIAQPGVEICLCDRTGVMHRCSMEDEVSGDPVLSGWERLTAEGVGFLRRYWAANWRLPIEAFPDERAEEIRFVFATLGGIFKDRPDAELAWLNAGRRALNGASYAQAARRGDPSPMIQGAHSEWQP